MPVEEIQRLVRFALQIYRGHHEWEDLLQIGFMGAWEALHGPAAQRCAPTTAVTRGAVWAVTAYFRSRACHPNDYRRSDGRGKEIQWLSTSRFEDEGDGEPVAPDFIGPTLNQIACQQLVRKLRQNCTERQWQLIELSYLRGLQTAGTAKALGLQPISVRSTVRTAFQNFRATIGDI